MKQVACHYAIVRFMPFVETGEFANVGILLLAPERQFFGFKLQLKRHKRITQFFDDPNAKLYKATMRTINEELTRVQKHLKSARFSMAKDLFNEVVRPKETIARYSEPRLVVTEDPEKQLNDLYNHYVERAFVTQEYREKAMERAVQKILTQAQVEKYFHSRKLTAGYYSTLLPFVEGAEGRPPLRAIKPLNLAQDRPGQIFDHGAAWAAKLKILHQHKVAPKRMLFTVEGSHSTPAQEAAFVDAVNELKNAGAEVLSMTERDKITNFVTH
ncbi:DUF3037 domain-containing protein [Microbulbifer sp. DLAB2-AF]|uniref:DUF3037 domain-containing protein n=1 Tax=Microbulbifer sp. DLAB2-AF TaxID=3243395 RepID=UPI0040399364